MCHKELLEKTKNSEIFLWFRCIVLIFYFQSKPTHGRGRKGLDVEVSCEEDYTSVPEPRTNEKELEDASFPDTQLHEHAVSDCLFLVHCL
jgi:hypothetical protein